MSARKAKLLRKFVAVERASGVHVDVGVLESRLSAMSHRDRGAVLGRIRDGVPRPEVKLRDAGEVLDLTSVATRVKQPTYRPGRGTRIRPKRRA